MTEPVFVQLARVLTLIEAQLHESIAVSELARAAGYSTWHFQRVFAAVLGEPVASYIRRRRLTEAARRIRQDHSLRMLDVALAAGFDSHEAFTRAFRRESGRTPSAFRREARPSFSWMRAPLRADQLRLIPFNMNLEPTFIELPSLVIAGFSARFIAAMSPDANNMEIIPPLWREFSRRRAEFPAAADAPAYGACHCLPPDVRTREDELDYLAGVEVDAAAMLPADAVRWEIAAQRYACFTHRGPIERFPALLQYVFGSWLPRSGFEIAPVAELERYDERFQPGSETSELDYLLPIQART